jgi:3-methyladenine DNA glycosylase AlkD
MDRWIEDPYLWIRRAALLYQLRWKQETDEEKLFSYCQKTLHEKDFFIRKAIGWVLREYSKTNPKAVKKFISSHRNHLSNLSIREGSKYLDNF